MHPIFAYWYDEPFRTDMGIEWDTDLIKIFFGPIRCNRSGIAFKCDGARITIYKNDGHNMSISNIIKYDDPDHGEELMRMCKVVQSIDYGRPTSHKILYLWVKL